MGALSRQNARDLLLRRVLRLRPHLDPPHLVVTAVGPRRVAVRMTARFASTSAAVRLVIAAGPHLVAGGTMVRLVSTHAAAMRWPTAPKSQSERNRMQKLQMSSDLNRH